ncbi:histidine phosphatase family protein [Streptomyces luteireticuli]|uniref:Histidine phosphatase family protein n=1 Tax=Streptomyces luteireticuli TaxID=173858 RepID=A0ABP3ISA5_9ACTN
MTTYLVRHAQTEYSTHYQVNGDPALPMPLTEDGVRACAAARTRLPGRSVRTWVASGFPRAQQTATLLMSPPAPRLVTETQLNELSYGSFEGGPFLAYADWLCRYGPRTRPPGAPESQREGIRRMLLGVRSALALPAPRVLVAHGLLVSVLLWHRGRSPDETLPLFFPEAGCLEPLIADDARLSSWTAELLAEINSEDHGAPFRKGDCRILRTDQGPQLATFDLASRPPQE